MLKDWIEKNISFLKKFQSKKIATKGMWIEFDRKKMEDEIIKTNSVLKLS
jgi:hypothetical protein